MKDPDRFRVALRQLEVVGLIVVRDVQVDVQKRYNIL